jgi:hypothetical protein
MAIPVTNAHPTEAQPLKAPRTGPVGRVVRLLLAVGFAYGFATLVDQGGPASIRDPETLTDVATVVLTIASVAVYAVLVTELAKLVDGEAVARPARSKALAVLAMERRLQRSSVKCARERCGARRVRPRPFGVAPAVHHRSPPPRRVGAPSPFGAPPKVCLTERANQKTTGGPWRGKLLAQIDVAMRRHCS